MRVERTPQPQQQKQQQQQQRPRRPRGRGRGILYWVWVLGLGIGIGSTITLWNMTHHHHSSVSTSIMRITSSSSTSSLSNEKNKSSNDEWDLSFILPREYEQQHHHHHQEQHQEHHHHHHQETTTIATSSSSQVRIESSSSKSTSSSSSTTGRIVRRRRRRRIIRIRIVLTVNHGFYDFFWNWWRHYQQLEITEDDDDDSEKREEEEEERIVQVTIAIIAEDPDLYQEPALQGLIMRLRDENHNNNHNHSSSSSSTTTTTTILLERSNLTLPTSAEKKYGSRQYKQLVSTRAGHLRRHLLAEANNNNNADVLSDSNDGNNSTEEEDDEVWVIYTDMDTVWKKNPLPYFIDSKHENNKNEDDNNNNNGTTSNRVDMWMQIDKDEDEQGNRPYYCTGFMVMRPTSPSVLRLMELWDNAMNQRLQLNQPVLNHILHQELPSILEREGLPPLVHRGFPRRRFPSGDLFFQSSSSSSSNNNNNNIMTQSDRDEAVVVHANFMRGAGRKRERFQEFGLWLLSDSSNSDQDVDTRSLATNDVERITVQEPSSKEWKSEDPEERRRFFRSLNVSTATTLPTVQAILEEYQWPPPTMLSAVADEKNRILLASVNCGYIDFCDNWIGSLLQFNATNYLLLPLSWDTHDILVDAYGLRHVLPPMPGVSLPSQETAYFHYQEFALMTKIRPVWLRAVVLAGRSHNISVYYNDVDTVWVKDAWRDLEDEDRLDPTTEYDVQISSDDALQARRTYPNPNLCSCQLFLKSTRGTLNFLQGWIDYTMLRPSLPEDQKVLNEFLFRAAHSRRHGKRWLPRDPPKNMTFRYRLPRDLFKYPPGASYFNAKRNRTSAVVIHNNWLSGAAAKRERFQREHLWKPTGRLPPTLNLTTHCTLVPTFSKKKYK